MCSFPLSGRLIACPNYCFSHQLKLFFPSKWPALNIFITLNKYCSQYSFCLIHLSYVHLICFKLDHPEHCYREFSYISVLVGFFLMTLGNNIVLPVIISILLKCWPQLYFFNLNLAFSRPLFLNWDCRSDFSVKFYKYTEV